MKSTVRLIEGLHITAADKRNILECIEYLRGEENHAQWLGRKGSAKRYCLTSDPEQANRFHVLIGETYRTDSGGKRERQSKVTIETTGVEPLLAASWQIDQGDLFDGLDNNEAQGPIA